MWMNRCFQVAMIAAACLLVGATGKPAAKAAASVTQNVRYKRFPETISPDGSYAVAWGDRIERSTTTATFTEVPYAAPRSDLAQMGGIQDYLVETRRGKGPVPIPNVQYFSGIEGHEAKRG